MTSIKFRRTKGIIWVCDVANSSSYLNNNDLADQIEKFIPRFYYVSKLIVESFGGVFLKWTGDGFMAFFELRLDRHKETIANKVFEAAWHLSAMTNLTQLDLKPTKKFKIRHGVTYEKDAFLMKIEEQGKQNIDIIGRAVVLAFRLSGIQGEFPSIVTLKELVHSSKRNFRKWTPSRDEKLKFFKGEKFGTQTIVVSARTLKRPAKSLKSASKIAKRAISSAESIESLDMTSPLTVFTLKMLEGPDWCKKVVNDVAEFVNVKLLGTLKEVVAMLDEKKKQKKKEL